MRASLDRVKFPKFTGCTAAAFVWWYPRLLGVLANPDWDSLYGCYINDIIRNDSVDPDLSKYLYSGLVYCLEGDAAEIMVGKDKF